MPFGPLPQDRPVVLLTGFGIVGFLTARYVGKAIDRFGAGTTAILGATLGAAMVAAVGTAPLAAVVVLCWALTGAAAQGVLVSINALVLQSENANRGGSVSVVQSLRFMGVAAAPLAFVPLLARLPGAPLWIAGVWVAGEALIEREPFGGFPWSKLAFGQAGGAFAKLASLGGAPDFGAMSFARPTPKTKIYGGTEDVRWMSEVEAMLEAKVQQLPRTPHWQAGGRVAICFHVDVSGRVTVKEWCQKSGCCMVLHRAMRNAFKDMHVETRTSIHLIHEQ